MTIYSTNKDGEITIVFDSRWQNPETLGYKPADPEYALLRKLWEEAMKEDNPDKENFDEKTKAIIKTD